ncbi:MAG: cytochrome c3 family protein [Acidobacteriota bacterium]
MSPPRSMVAAFAMVPVFLYAGGRGAEAAADDAACLECHGGKEQAAAAADAFGLTLSPDKLARLAVGEGQKGSVHADLGCIDCHPKASEVPHPAGMTTDNPCVTCHDDELKAVNKSIHRDPTGGNDLRAPCWACHGAHGVLPAKDPKSTLSPPNVAKRCLACHDKQEYLAGVHGWGVEMAGLNVAATCVSCHGGHDILPPSDPASLVSRAKVSFTCGKCHGSVAETYRKSVHGAALTDHDNPDVPTCVGCHKAHATADPRSPRFRNASPEICGRCHGDAKLMKKYGLPADIFTTYVADFHGTTAELFEETSPDQPLNQAVCYDCHGYHDVQSVKGVGQREINQRLLVRCQACHPGATFGFLSAWTSHYVPSPKRYALIYYVRLFYRFVIPGTIGFFLLYIAVDVWGRRRQRRSS